VNIFDNNTGNQTKLICTNDEGMSGICEDGKCTVKGMISKNMTRVEIELEGDGMTESDLDKAKEQMSDKYSVSVVLERSEDGIIVLVIYVDDERASKIAEDLHSCINNNQNQNQN